VRILGIWDFDGVSCVLAVEGLLSDTATQSFWGASPPIDKAKSVLLMFESLLP